MTAESVVLQAEARGTDCSSVPVPVRGSGYQESGGGGGKTVSLQTNWNNEFSRPACVFKYKRYSNIKYVGFILYKYWLAKVLRFKLFLGS